MNFTPKQLQILDLILRGQEEKGYSPTYAEIAERLKVSAVTVFEHVQSIEKKGAIRRRRYEARSSEMTQLGIDAVLRFRHASARASGAAGAAGAAGLAAILPGTGRETETLPLVGRIAAGRPIEAIETPEEVAIGRLFAGPGERFLLEVAGDSMVGDHILSGDYVVVEKRPNALPGEVVVALLPDGTATLKRFYREPDGRIRLQPANASHAPLYVNRVEVQGVVRGVIRRWR